MDEDLDQKTREELIEEVKRLRHGIREHRPQTKTAPVTVGIRAPADP